MCNYSNNERYLKPQKNSVICSFLLLISCNFLRQNNKFLNAKKLILMERSKSGGQVINYFHFNDNRLDISLGTSRYWIIVDTNCDKTEFIYKCTDLKKDNFDDQVTLDRFTLAAQQIRRSTKRQPSLTMNV